MKLSDDEQRVLNILARRFLSSEDCSPSAIAVELGWPARAVQTALDRLEALGFVARQPRGPVGQA